MWTYDYLHFIDEETDLSWLSFFFCQNIKNLVIPAERPPGILDGSVDSG